MRLLTIDDIVDIAEYELHRVDFRKEIIDLKKMRRVQVGDLVSLVFENRETMKFQIQEMMRTERIVTRQRIIEEIDTYNALLPGKGQISATLLIEVTDQHNLRQILDRFIGIDGGGTTFLETGGKFLEGVYETGHSKEARVSAVHYVTFNLNRHKLLTGTEVALVIDHSNYKARQVLSDELLNSLSEDLNEL